jgi:DNA-binding response OmpR family regulator
MDEHQEPSRPAAAITVVLVEDHAELGARLTDLLTDAGIHVLATAGTQREGHHDVTTHRPHLAVIDNNLPDGYGIDLCRSLTTDAPEVTLLLHTAGINAVQTRAALDSGATAVVVKTPQGDSLLEAIRSHAPTARRPPTHPTRHDDQHP